MSTMLLQAKNICAYYGPTQVLHGLDLSIAEGGITTLLGANGAGKTTMLRSVCGMVRTTGEVRFRGHEIAGKATEDIVRLGIAHVPEGRGTFVRLTVEENLQLGAITRGNKAEIAADVERVFGYFPRLRERYRQQAGTLSGGEQQMLAIGRALMSRPRLLLLDEPSLGLAPLVVHTIFEAIDEIRSKGTTILLVEQNAHAALGHSDRAYVLETGRIVMEGPSKQLAADPRIKEAYLGE